MTYNNIPGPLFTPIPADVRFFAKVEKTPTCWLWTASTITGYGVFRDAGKSLRAHRWSYARFRGPIPDGMVIDHLCRQKLCVNPAHLEPVLIGENTRRGLRGWGMTGGRCHSGLHDITDPANVYIKPTGARSCRVCMAYRSRRNKRKASA